MEFHPHLKNELVSTTLSGQLFLWDTEEGNMRQFIECRNDIAGGRMQDERQTAKNSTKNKHFNSMALSPAGDFVLAGGNSKNICLYDLRHKVLLRRFAITQNRSLDGVLWKLNSKNVKEGGLMQHELDELDSDLEEDAWQSKDDLPGAKQAKNLVKRKTRLAVRVKCVKFSPDGTCFAAATTEGLVLFCCTMSRDADFDPALIDENVTLDNIIGAVKREQPLTAMTLALRLDHAEVTHTVFNSIPLTAVPLLCANFPKVLLTRLLQMLTRELERGHNVEWTMTWVSALLLHQGEYLQATSQGSKSQICSLLVNLLSQLQFTDTSLIRVAQQNQHLMDFMVKKHERQSEQEALTAAQSHNEEPTANDQPEL